MMNRDNSQHPRQGWAKSVALFLIAFVALALPQYLFALDADTVGLMLAFPAAVATHPTLLDQAKRLDPNGTVAKIVEMLAQVNPILDQAVFLEGNLPTGHRTTVRSGLPEPTWRRLYGGVQPSKSTTVQVTDNCGMLEDYGEVDKALADLNGNTAAFRLSEDQAHIQGMSHKVARYMFYGNEGSEPAAFTGIAPRFNSLSAENADNIVDAGGTAANNTSAYLTVWGEQSVHGIFPKGSKAGLQSTDKGQVTKENVDGNGGMAEFYRTHYRWDVGLTVRDWRQVARVCNIDIGALDTAGELKKIIRYMIEASERIYNLGAGRPVWYVSRAMRTALRIAILEKIATNLTWETVAGKRVMVFDDIPVERCDAILNSEARVV